MSKVEAFSPILTVASMSEAETQVSVGPGKDSLIPFFPSEADKIALPITSTVEVLTTSVVEQVPTPVKPAVDSQGEPMLVGVVRELGNNNFFINLVTKEITPEVLVEAVGPLGSTVGVALVVGGAVGVIGAKKGEKVKSMLDGATRVARSAAIGYFFEPYVKSAMSTVFNNLGTIGLVLTGTLLLGGIGYAILKRSAAPQAQAA